MGVKGLSTYIKEYLSEVLVRHRLHNRNIIIDGNNLAHILYHECTGINAAFGGDYDKYAAFVQEYFERLQSCEVRPIIIMDGGQPLDGRKMRTVRERIGKQINTCLDVTPSNQFRMKVFPCMGRQVFVTTLKKMGLPVFQTDFEADVDIATLAKSFDLTVLSNDSDFYIFDVLFILLESINYKRVQTCKKKGKESGMMNYLPCYHFSQEKFCELTGMDAAHLPILATVLGNDYIVFDYFNDFYAAVEINKTNRRMGARHKTIKSVISWLASRKGNSTNAVIRQVVHLANCKNLCSKMKKSIANYTDMKTNLTNFIQSNVSIYNPAESCSRDSAALVCTSVTDSENYVPVTEKFQNDDAEVETELALKNGEKLPAWFVRAYRLHIIPHEVASILTQRYFISPPHVEELSQRSSYLVVKPIVKSVFNMLWRGVQAVDDPKQEEHVLEHHVCVSDEGEDSDVVVEEDDVEVEEEENDVEVEVEEDDLEVEEEENDVEEKKKYNVQVSAEEEKVDENHDEAAVLEGDCHSSVGGRVDVDQKVYPHKRTWIVNKTCRLRWYLRKGRGIWIKNINLSTRIGVGVLPSLNEVSSMALSDKKAVFYSILKSKSDFHDMDVPGDLELILDFIIFWFRNSRLHLEGTHALSVLICVFMYYIIDGKIGRVRTRKAFEEVESCKAKLSEIQSSEGYCGEGAGVVLLLAQVCREECLIASANLFQFHHLHPKMNDSQYTRGIVHAFCEYQACIYFVQLLNTLLGTPFPMLSVECLWGGTFCYNIFTFLHRRQSPLIAVSDILGSGTCLEKLFLMLFNKLSELLRFPKYSTAVLVAQKAAKRREKRKKRQGGTHKNVSDSYEDSNQKGKTKKEQPGKKNLDNGSSKTATKEEPIASTKTESPTGQVRGFAVKNSFATLINDSDVEE